MIYINDIYHANPGSWRFYISLLMSLLRLSRTGYLLNQNPGDPTAQSQAAAAGSSTPESKTVMYAFGWLADSWT